MTTELQPSQPSYRSATAGQDKFDSNGLQTKPYRPQHIAYSNSNHQQHQQLFHQQTRIRPENELNNFKGSYDDQAFCRKNSVGYKNDSGYSESLGFESFSLALSERDTGSPPPAPPVRDASSLKSLRYGPGHEKYPSWPSSAPECRYSGAPSGENGVGSADASDELIGGQGGSHRSKSWTDHTNYPKEKPAQYSRPHSKRSNASFTQQLKTVMEKCEKIPSETFESRSRSDMDLQQQQQHEPQQQQQIRMWPSVDREGKSLGDADYVVPSPPERESLQTTTLNPADLEAYVRSYQDPQVSQVGLYGDGDLSQTGLMDEYTTVQHSQQASYAQSEGYHSYVSSVDSTTTTPFLDRLRRDSEAVTSSGRPLWDEVSSAGGGHREGRDSVVTTSSGSASSSETLKWHGSMSDVSISSCSQQQRWQHSGSMSDVSSSIVSRHHHDQIGSSDQQQQLNAISRQQQQLIAHSARVQTPQRHHSESVLYLDDRRQQLRQSQRKLYPVSTTKLDEPPPPPPPPPLPPSPQNSTLTSQEVDRLSTTSSQQPQQQQPSVAERISELERQQQQLSQQMRYTYLDPDKRHRVSDPTLKAIQKKALLSFYERHQQQQQQHQQQQQQQHQQGSWRSEPHLLSQSQSQAPAQQQQHQGNSPPPQPPPRPRPTSSRRASCASDYALNKPPGQSQGQQSQQQAETAQLPQPRHQHSNSCGSLSTDLLGPVIVGPVISIDDWVPERPPKKPHLRNAYSERLPSPDLPPPSPPTVTDVEVINFDDPLPPPPPELSPQNCSSKPSDSKNALITDPSSCDRIKGRSSSSRRSSRRKNSASTQQTSETPPKCKSASPSRDLLQQRRVNQTPSENKPSAGLASNSGLENGFGSSSRLAARGRSSLRFTSSTRKREKSGIEDEPRLAPYGLTSSTSGSRGLSNAQQLTDLLAQRFSNSGNQRAAPQVPVIATVSSCRQAVPKLARQESHGKRDEWLQQKQRRSSSSSSSSNSPSGSPSSSSPTSPSKTNCLYQPQQQQQRGYISLPPKYSDEVFLQQQQQPPPLAPRATHGRKLSPPPRPAPPSHSHHLGSQSKASYLAYRRERGAPDSEGSYKRSMSPSSRLESEPSSILLAAKIASHHQSAHIATSHTNNNRHELSKSQSSDALQPARVVDEPLLLTRKSLHQSVASCLDSTLGQNQLQRRPSSEVRRAERLSPQSVEVLNDRNRQLERERRKLVASCEPVGGKLIGQCEIGGQLVGCDNTTTIEMTSRNVEMLNRRNERQRAAVGTFESHGVERGSPTKPAPNLQQPTSPLFPVSVTSTTTTTFTSTSTSTSRSPESERRPSSLSPRSSGSSINSDSLYRQTVSQQNHADQQSLRQCSTRARPSVTNDVASQTDSELGAMADEAVQTQLSSTPPQSPQQQILKDSLAQPRRKLREEIECEMLSKDLADRLQPDHKLLPLLVPLPEHKKSTDYVVDLFRVEAAPQPRPRPKLSIEDQSIADCSDSEIIEDKRIESIPTTPITPSCPEPPSTPSSPFGYPNAGCEATKPRLLARYSHEVINEQIGTASLPPTNTTTTTTTTEPSSDGTSAESLASDSFELRQKKEELMMRLDKKLVVLRAEQEAVREEGELNEDLGARVSSRLAALARPTEASKYRLHVEEVGKITSLLLGLSGRLARLENALFGMPNDHVDRKVLESKRDKLVEQLEEAKTLKSNIDRRSVNVSAILSKYLTDDEFADYQHFINMKAKLIVDGREIQDKVKLGEEQLAALKEAIDL